VRPEHVRPVREALMPTPLEIAHAKKVVADFEAARQRGEDRVLVDGLWIDVPTYLNARRLARSQ
jgi:citrate lyase subunit beta/citryl-CoA lyase